MVIWTVLWCVYDSAVTVQPRPHVMCCDMALLTVLEPVRVGTQAWLGDTVPPDLIDDVCRGRRLLVSPALKIGVVAVCGWRDEEKGYPENQVRLTSGSSSVAAFTGCDP